MAKSSSLFLFLSASVLCGAGFADIPEKKQKNPGRAACEAGGPAAGGAAGIAITEEGGPNQHADKPRPKGLAASGGGGTGGEAATGTAARTGDCTTRGRPGTK